ncbi:MAG: GGDEF domain-containing protein [Actinomycetota bacterium]|nr:GGDEF domain-containing protein [Myxococcota bacterium]MDQ3178480.1 GGDEF domain-containing protein [Actinomycetota bacterium]
MTNPNDRTMQVDVRPSGAGDVRDDRRGMLTVLSGDRPGRLIEIDGNELVVGRTDDATLKLPDDSLSRKHARFFRLVGQHWVADLGSTNGTFVNGVKITEPTQLDDGAKIQLGLATVLRFGLTDKAVAEEARRLYEATVRDRLTGAYNRHYLDERLQSEWSFAKRHGSLLAVLFVDADHFKKVNDTHGHAGGDAVLRALSATLLASVRGEDVVARYGGEEFVILLRGVPLEGVSVAAERIRNDVASCVIEHDGKTIPVTVSIGVALHEPSAPAESIDALVARADAALYRAKETGRNRVCCG